ncbi:hypothetical protein [Confluentibacter flavum]|uniref:Uncharacterized protein n=1 Tax=Confluentibacter flavum TaxID=1909700 RepID=A0A2N3HNY5_9FLAO|nr:hypothetical protein [Confluentibacter flavum]PKQ46693.1 hypothetical protein CSW08_01455 [Confluentibacter flavum]
MKKGTLIFSKFLSLAVFATLIFSAFTSCREEKAKTETVIIEKPVEQPKAEEKDGTSISVDGDGVEYSNKSGDNKTEITIKD